MKGGQSDCRCIDLEANLITPHPFQTLLHKIEKTLMLETDVSETVNEMILSVRKMGRIGLIAVYSGFTNHFNRESHRWLRHLLVHLLTPSPKTYSRRRHGTRNPLHWQWSSTGS